MSNIIEKRRCSGDVEDDFDNIENKKVHLDEDVEEDIINDDIEETIQDLGIEQRAGICEFMDSNIKGFFGVIKQRFSDFHVNEIDTTDAIVHLNSFDLPIIDKPEINMDQNEVDRLIKAISEEKFKQLIEFCEKNDRNSKFQIVAPNDKSDRKLLHEYIKSKHINYISNTVQQNKDQLIEIYHKFFSGLNSQGSFKRKDKIHFNYCQFVLYKDNIDTLQAVNLLSQQLRIPPRRISYAGTKDKRAKTCQLMSIFKLEPKEILKVNDRSNQIKCGNYTLTDNGLKLGDLNGNRFTIVLRQVEGDDLTIEKSINSLKDFGFINYYGLQRFGTTEIATHEIGLNLLKSNFKEAINLILKPRKTLKERYGIKAARESWDKNHNPEEAFDLIKNCNCLEKFLLKGLLNCEKNDYLGAFNYIPRNMRLMYIHAYQSYVWNMAASERIRKPLKPICGDLVYDKRKEGKFSYNIIKLESNNIDSYSIEDVLLPLPGHNILYPHNEIADFYKTLLSKDGLDINKMQNQIKEISLSGDYRNLIGIADQLEYETVFYKDSKIDLVLSDYEKLSGVKLNGVNYKYDEKDFPLKAIILKFNLKTSSYATMALREILKLDTSQSFQASLNKN